MSKQVPLLQSTSDFWENLYLSGETGWDLGGFTPIFNQWIETIKYPKIICVLGSGNGWDAINFASKGHIVTAVDFSKSAVRSMELKAKENNIKLEIIHKDIFDLVDVYKNHFDIVLEYTCYCAIDPKRRNDYMEMVKHILKPNGRFVGLLFPIDKDLSEGGPPYGVNIKTTIRKLSEYLSFEKSDYPELSVKSRLGRELFVIFKKYGN